MGGREKQQGDSSQSTWQCPCKPPWSRTSEERASEGFWHESAITTCPIKRHKKCSLTLAATPPKCYITHKSGIFINPEFLYSPLKIIVINIYLYVSTQSHKLCSLIKFLIVYTIVSLSPTVVHCLWKCLWFQLIVDCLYSYQHVR